MEPLTGSIVIVTHNSAEQIQPCLQSLSCEDWERIVVDNASRDGTAERARAIPQTRVIVNRENKGFAAAACQGAETATGPLILFLNPDVVAEVNALSRMEMAARAEKVAAVGGRLVNSDGSTQIGFTIRRLPSATLALWEILLINRLIPGNPWNRHYRCLDFDHDRPAEVEQPAGACLLVKREAWEEVGGFDTGFYPLWFEDVDLCRRLRARGWKILYEPAARFRHLGGHSLAGVPAPERKLYWYRNLLRYFRKYHGFVTMTVLRAALFVGMLLRIAGTLAGAGGRQEDKKILIRAYVQVIRQCVFGAAVP